MRYFSRHDFQSPHIDSGIWTVPNVWVISYRLLYCRRAQNHFLPNFTSKKLKLKKSQSPPELCVLISSDRFTSIQNILYMLNDFEYNNWCLRHHLPNQQQIYVVFQCFYFRCDIFGILVCWPRIAAAAAATNDLRGIDVGAWRVVDYGMW